jgi:hypothetical protein
MVQLNHRRYFSRWGTSAANAKLLHIYFRHFASMDLAGGEVSAA